MEKEGEPLDTKLADILTKGGGHEGEEGGPRAGGLEVSPILLLGTLRGLCGAGIKRKQRHGDHNNTHTWGSTNLLLSILYYIPTWRKPYT